MNRRPKRSNLTQRRLLLTFSSLIAILCCRPSIADDGWIELFNGKDLSGWKVSENPDSIRVEDGLMVVNGPRAHAFAVDAGEYKNFYLKAELMTYPKANSGIYFHTKYLESGWPNVGYEAQVNTSHGDPKKTGGLYSIQDNFDPPTKDNEWFTYEIIVIDPHIIIKINGKTISDYSEPDDLVRPERQLSAGLFAIQAHDPDSKVVYRSIKVKRLP